MKGRSRILPMSETKGFTLIELLVVVSLLSVIALAIYGALAAGVRVVQYVSSQRLRNDLMIDLMRIQKDLRGHLKYRLVPFVGHEGELSFPSFVSVKGEEGDEGVHREVGRIRYYRDALSESLCREVLTYVEWKNGAEGYCLPVFTFVSDASFEYFGQDERGMGPGSWRPEWTKEFPPLAVLLKIMREGGVEEQFTTLLP